MKARTNHYYGISKMKYLEKDDVGAGGPVTITWVGKVKVTVNGAKPMYKFAMSFQEFDKPWIPNRTNIGSCKRILGSDRSHWVGKKLVLYNDPNISVAGKLTGGIRTARARRDGQSPQAKNPIQPSFFDE